MFVRCSSLIKMERHAELVSLAESAKVTVSVLKAMMSDFDARVQETLRRMQDTLNPGLGINFIIHDISI